MKLCLLAREPAAETLNDGHFLSLISSVGVVYRLRRWNIPSGGRLAASLDFTQTAGRFKCRGGSLVVFSPPRCRSGCRDRARGRRRASLFVISEHEDIVLREDGGSPLSVSCHTHTHTHTGCETLPCF